MKQNDLDARIREALRVEPPREQIARLEEFWRQHSSTERQRRRILVAVGFAATVAATILLALTSAVYFRQGETQQVPAAACNHTPATTHQCANVANCSAARHNPAVSQSPPPDKPLATGRQPTGYERLFFLAKTGSQTVARRSAATEKIDEVIERIAQDEATTADFDEIIACGDLTTHNVERLLLEQLFRGDDARKRLVLRLLADYGSTDSIPQLLRLGSRNTFRDECLSLVEKIAGIEHLAPLAAQTEDANLRAAIYRRLLNSGSESALRGYLSLLRHKTLGGEALAAAEGISGELLNQLLALLRDGDEGVRLAVAMVLGHANGPEVETALIEFVMEEPVGKSDAKFSTEAWLAILSCRGPKIEEFIDFVMREPKLLGHLNRARARLAQMTL